jgi:hypothetical protein
VVSAYSDDVLLPLRARALAGALGAIQAAIFGEKAAAAAGFLTPGTVARDANYVTLASQRPRLGQSRRSSYGDTAEDNSR